jgi:MoCo/4Fe-4S cofactor protein with predicted Tat translocation signal
MPPLDTGTNAEGQQYWRSLDQLADTPEFREFLEREFPQGASELSNPITRRHFLTLMGASLALAGLAGCRRPVEKIIPYVVPPEELVPGIPQYYATTMPWGTGACGLIVESHEGRPTKIEGNPRHPSSLGKTNAQIQASILNLYDPDRSANVLENGGERTWDDFVVHWQERFAHFRETNGQGLAVLSESFASPTLARLKAQFTEAFPQARWVVHEPVSDENIDEGNRIATGQSLRPVYHFDRAKTILSLDSDFLLTERDNITATFGFANGRRIETTRDEMNRLYVVESGFSLTGTLADHRLRMKSSQIGAFAAALAAELINRGLNLGIDKPSVLGTEIDRRYLAAVADELYDHRGEAIVIAGRNQPPQVHALVFAINQALGNNGSVVEFHEYTDAALPQRSDLQALADDMKAGIIETLFVIGGNPVHNAPADLRFAGSLGEVEDSVHLTTHVNETSRKTTWHLPQTHFLEQWGDARAADGTQSVVQPLIEPLYGGHSDVEVANLIVTGRDQRGYELVRETWKTVIPVLGFEDKWNHVLHDGVLADSGTAKIQPELASASVNQYLSKNPIVSAPRTDGLEVVFAASPAVYDGRFANNGWLQELPDPVAKITWDNAAHISPHMAEALGLASEDVVTLTADGREIELPVWVQPGHADDCVTVHLGYGRTAAGRVGNNVGANVCALQSLANPFILTGATIRPTLRKHRIAGTQDHGSMEGRPIIREATLDEFREDPKFAEEAVEHPPLKSLWKEHSYDEGNQWGMTVDLNACTGCSACTIACQSENNIPVVGAEQVANGREMHWMRIDRYYSGDTDEPLVAHQPVPCMHCENAPCEQVCPVAATMHSADGLNVMTYNRCIGTRYCSNNCPYKVRRFNFFNYTKDTPEVEKMAMNPNVTVRFRGVMEKCTYCIQRISRARITAKDENRDIADGDVKTACQQVCPADAIVFGNINDPESKVSRIKKMNRRYELLAELNVQPRTSYMAKIRNPNPKLEPTGESSRG